MASSDDTVLCWVSIICDGINFAFGLVLIPLLIFKFFEAYRHDLYIKKMLSVSSLFFLSVSTITPLAWILFRVESCGMPPFDHLNLPQLSRDLTGTLLVAVLIIHKILFHGWILLRIWATFRRTSYTLTIKGVAVYVAVFSLEVLCQSVYDFNELYAGHPFLGWTLIGYMTIDFLLCAAMIWLFLHKLYGIMLLKALNGDTEAYSGAGSEWLDHGVMQNSFQVCAARQMVKQFVLCAVALSARIVVDLVIFADEFAPGHEFWNIYDFSILRKVLSVTAICVQMICVYTSYAFSDDLYHCCCSCCHSRCHRCIDNCAQKRYLKELGPELGSKYFRL